MILQEEKVEIVEDAKSKETATKNELLNQNNSKPIYVYIIAFIGALLLILIIIFAIFTFYNLSKSTVIANGVSIYGIDVSGLNKKEALQKISGTFEKIKNTDIKLNYEDFEAAINPSEINLNFDTNSAVNYAFSIGKNGNIFSDDYDVFNAMINGVEIIPSYSLNEDSLKDFLNIISKSLPNAVKESSYYIEGSKLIITKGSDGYVINILKTESDLKSKIKNLSYLSEPVNLTLSPGKPSDVDLDKIYSEVHKNAKDAYFTKNPYAVYPSENGVDFKISIEEAKQGLSNAEKEYTIPLKTVYPKVTTNMLGKEAFPHLLGEYTTTYNSSKTNRTTNLKLAAKKINGTVLLPGETFSYNKVVGERTIAAGFKDAGVYVNGELVDGLGGGICQVSSTIFNAVLFANLKIEEVHYHPYVSSYVPIGRDATVAYGLKDFQFSNSRKYAIKIECTVSGGVAKCKIYGFKENPEYDVKINVVTTSKTSTYTKTTTYRNLYLNDKKVSSERIYSCTYKKH